MPLWIKICGLTTPDGVAAAVRAGADALGFVFAPSARQVTPERAAELAAEAPPGIARVAVMLRPEQALVEQVLEVFRPDLLQTDLVDFATLAVPAGLERLPVVRSGQTLPDPLPARLLLEGYRSGAGERADWCLARELSRATHVVLAGGLDAGNVAKALAEVQPFGIDVSSGVESAPGIKSPERIVEFVNAARRFESARGES